METIIYEIGIELKRRKKFMDGLSKFWFESKEGVKYTETTTLLNSIYVILKERQKING